jgi:hypothetical protein
MNCKPAILLFGFWALVLHLQAQHRLLLVKGNRQIYAFHEADYIRFKRSDREHFTAGFIGGIYPEAFRIGQDTTWLSQIQKIDLTDLPYAGFKTAQAGKVLLIAGVTFFVGDALNTTLVADEPYSLHRGVAVSTALLCGTGLVMQFVNNNYFKVGRKKKVLITRW